MTTTGHIDLNWQPELADYVEAFRVRNRLRRANLKVALLSLVVVAIGVLGVIADAAGAVGVAVGGVIAILLIRFVAQPAAVRGLWKRSARLREQVVAQVDAQVGVVLRNETGASETRWSGIQGFIETERLFIIQLAGLRNSPFMVLPKRGVANPRQVDDLRALLSAGTNSAPLS